MQYGTILPGSGPVAMLYGGKQTEYGNYSGTYGGFFPQPQQQQLQPQAVQLVEVPYQFHQNSAIHQQQIPRTVQHVPRTVQHVPRTVQQVPRTVQQVPRTVQGPQPILLPIVAGPHVPLAISAPTPLPSQRIPQSLVPLDSYRTGRNNISYSLDGRVENRGRYVDIDYGNRYHSPNLPPRRANSWSPPRYSGRDYNDGYHSINPRHRQYLGDGYNSHDLNRRRGSLSPPRRRSDYDDRDNFGQDDRGRPRKKKKNFSSKKDAGPGTWYGGWHGEPRRRSIEISKNNDRAKPRPRGRPRSNSLPVAYDKADKTALISRWSQNGDYGVFGRHDGYDRGRHNNYTVSRPSRWIFYVTGALTVVVAVFLILFGCRDQYYQSGFWAGGMLIFLGVCGTIHRGIYSRNSWRTYLYVGVGLVASVACMAATAFVMRNLVPQIKLIALVGIDLYATGVTQTGDPPIKLNSSTGRVWACLAMDVILLLCLMGGCYAMTSAVDVASSHYNVHKHYRRTFRRNDPYCKPYLFNPFLQVPLCMAALWVGLLSHYTAEGSVYFKYWSPAWAAPLGIIGGCMAGFSMKRPDRKILLYCSILAEVIVVGVCVGAAVLTLLYLVDIAGPIDQLVTVLSTVTGFSKQVQTASACLLALTLILLAAVAVLAIGVLVRLVIAAFRKDRHRKPLRGYPYY